MAARDAKRTPLTATELEVWLARVRSEGDALARTADPRDAVFPSGSTRSDWGRAAPQGALHSVDLSESAESLQRVMDRLQSDMAALRVSIQHATERVRAVEATAAELIPVVTALLGGSAAPCSGPGGAGGDEEWAPRAPGDPPPGSYYMELTVYGGPS